MEMDDEDEITPTGKECIKDKMMNINEKMKIKRKKKNTKANHAMGYPKVRSRFQWRKHNTSKDWFWVGHLQQSPLKFVESETKNQVDNRADMRISEEFWVTWTWKIKNKFLINESLIRLWKFKIENISYIDYKH